MPILASLYAWFLAAVDDGGDSSVSLITILVVLAIIAVIIWICVTVFRRGGG